MNRPSRPMRMYDAAGDAHTRINSSQKITDFAGMRGDPERFTPHSVPEIAIFPRRRLFWGVINRRVSFFTVDLVGEEGSADLCRLREGVWVDGGKTYKNNLLSIEKYPPIRPGTVYKNKLLSIGNYPPIRPGRPEPPCLPGQTVHHRRYVCACRKIFVKK